ncbi:MAG: hypothetical protein IKJ35_07960 [Clostridia bacterium]|nr:hypothetical protein [Clostridia bacterium]
MSERRYGMKKEKTDVDTKGKTETFFTRHVRLITFLITLGVLLAAFLPIAYMEAREYYGQHKDSRPKMQIYDLVTLSEQPEIWRKQLIKFAGTESKQKGFSLIEMEIDPHYTVYASADAQTGEIVYCSLLNHKTNEKIDVLTADLRAYFGL